MKERPFLEGENAHLLLVPSVFIGGKSSLQNECNSSLVLKLALL